MVVTGSPSASAPAAVAVTTPGLAGVPQGQSVTSSLVPTLPPLPVAPTLIYEERSLIDTITERVSVQLALLIASATVLLSLAVVAFIRSFTATTPTRSLLTKVAKASSLAELEQCMRTWAARSIAGASPNATFDELRALVRTRKEDQSANLSILTLLDEIELGRYSSQGCTTDISDLQRRLAAIVKSSR
jgi:hypothetical protein